MAYQLNQEEQENQAQQGQGVENAPVNLTIASNAIQSSPNSSSPNGNSNLSTNAPKGSGFVNLSNYLDQNKKQANTLGKTISNDIVNTGNDAKSKIAQASNAFNDQAQNSRTVLDENKFKDTLNNANTASTEDKNEATKQLNNTYTGPTNLNLS